MSDSFIVNLLKRGSLLLGATLGMTNTAALIVPSAEPTEFLGKQIFGISEATFRTHCLKEDESESEQEDDLSPATLGLNHEILDQFKTKGLLVRAFKTVENELGDYDPRWELNLSASLVSASTAPSAESQLGTFSSSMYGNQGIIFETEGPTDNASGGDKRRNIVRDASPFDLWAPTRYQTRRQNRLDKPSLEELWDATASEDRDSFFSEYWSRVNKMFSDDCFRGVPVELRNQAFFDERSLAERTENTSGKAPILLSSQQEILTKLKESFEKALKRGNSNLNHTAFGQNSQYNEAIVSVKPSDIKAFFWLYSPAKQSTPSVFAPKSIKDICDLQNDYKRKVFEWNKKVDDQITGIPPVVRISLNSRNEWKAHNVDCEKIASFEPPREGTFSNIDSDKLLLEKMKGGAKVSLSDAEESTAFLRKIKEAFKLGPEATGFKIPGFQTDSGAAPVSASASLPPVFGFQTDSGAAPVSASAFLPPVFGFKTDSGAAPVSASASLPPVFGFKPDSGAAPVSASASLSPSEPIRFGAA